MIPCPGRGAAFFMPLREKPGPMFHTRSASECNPGLRPLDVLINDAAYNVAIPFGDLDNLTHDVAT